MSDDKPKTRKPRKPAKFVIEKWIVNSSDKSEWFWADQDIPDGCEPPDSTKACEKIIAALGLTGTFRINQVKRHFTVTVEQTPVVTITEIE